MTVPTARRSLSRKPHLPLRFQLTLIVALLPALLAYVANPSSGQGSLVYTQSERLALADESASFIRDRATQPFVHRFAFPEARGKYEVLVELVGPSAEDVYTAKWNTLFASGVSRSQPRRPPVCAAGIDNDDGELEPSSLVSTGGVRSVDTTIASGEWGLVDVHVNITHCRTVPGNPSTMVSTDTGPYPLGAPIRVTYRWADRFDLVDGLRPIVKLIPEGETWRVDVPFQLAYGADGMLGGDRMQVPPNCHMRVEVRVDRVLRGRTSLARCRQAITEAFGYDPYARDRDDRGGKHRDVEISNGVHESDHDSHGGTTDAGHRAEAGEAEDL